jgi:hypothetical protein
MNSFYSDQLGNDFRFVYLGGGTTSTALHRDVCQFLIYVSLRSLLRTEAGRVLDNSYSISTNIYGRKRWTLFPPSLTPLLLPIIKQAQYEDRSVDIREWTEELMTEFELKGMIQVIQAERETIFIPSGWFHQVRFSRTSYRTVL